MYISIAYHIILDGFSVYIELETLLSKQCFSFTVLLVHVYLCTYFVPKFLHGDIVLIVTLLKISKVSTSLFYYILINFVKCRLVVSIFCKLIQLVT